MLSNTLRLNFYYFKIIHILHSSYHPKLIEHILKSKQKNKCVCMYEIIWLIIMKIKMKMRNRSYRYDTIRLGLDMDTIIVNIKSLSIMMPICI